MTNTQDNGYAVGSLAWVERNRYNTVRNMLDALLAGDATADEIRQEVWAFDTDSASS